MHPTAACAVLAIFLVVVSSALPRAVKVVVQSPFLSASLVVAVKVCSLACRVVARLELARGVRCYYCHHALLLWWWSLLSWLSRCGVLLLCVVVRVLPSSSEVSVAETSSFSPWASWLASLGGVVSILL